MAIKPTRSEYDIGKDRYGRRTVLVEEVTGGQAYWNIRIEPMDQRDEGGRIDSLTADQLVSAGEIAAAAGRKR